MRESTRPRGQYPSDTKVTLVKFSNQALLKSLLALAAAMAQPSWIAAQEPKLTAEPQSTEQVSAERIEVASLLPLPELPAPSTVSTRSEGGGMAFAPVVGVVVTTNVATEHRFWDRENRTLFAVAGGFATADFFVTRRNLASGGKELNPVTRMLSGSTPGLAANFALEMGAVVGVNYLFHKTGHHKLERMTSLVNIGGSASAVAFDLIH